MNKKQFFWLLLATLSIATLVLLFPTQTGRESGASEVILMPGLAEQVNEVDWLRLTAAGNETLVTLKRDDTGWVVEEVFSYPANWSLVKNLLESLSRAEVVERKTANPDLYSKLGVGDISGAEAAGILIEFSETTGLPSVILGNPAQGRGGQYARLAGFDNSVLIDPVIELRREQNAWLDTSIVDISDAEVVEFEIDQPGSGSVRALKASADDENFELQNIPDNREIESEWVVNAPAGSLAGLEFQAVVPAEQLNWDEAVRFRILTADGLAVETELVGVEQDQEHGGQVEHWARLKASVYPAGNGSGNPMMLPSDETTSRAEQISNRTHGWAYRIPGYRFETMARDMESFLKPAGEDQ